ncbi:non-ribosomal peptide synthetase [Nocardia nova]|uniref:non-ribosomal peptide synthetase n=1 Tax=Nocardia nova TaxID=37330 RepID=UPI000A469014|nr:non-ribosomal peptide synthetase [Nocardia nova]
MTTVSGASRGSVAFPRGVFTPELSPNIRLGPMQRAYLVGDQEGLELRSPARYYLACDIEPARVEHIQAGLDAMVAADPALRTRIGTDLTPTPAEPDARIGVEIRNTPADGFDSVDAAIADEFRSDGFDFDSWPQIRVAVVNGPGRARLHVVYAMWLMDGASLSRFLEGLVSPDSAGTDPRSAAYGAEEPTRRDVRYWHRRVSDLPPAAEVPLRPGWRQSTRRMSHRLVRIRPDEANAVAVRARHHGLTVPMVYLSVYCGLLSAVGGGAAHTITVLQSQRHRFDADDALGNFGATMPLPVPSRAGRSFVAFAKEIQSGFLEQSLHSSLSGPEIARLADSGTAQRRLAYPFAFTAVEVDSAAEAGRGLRRDWDSVQLRVPQVLLDHQVILDSDGTIRLGFDWRTDAFDTGFVESFVDRYERLVEDLSAGSASWDAVREQVSAGTCEAAHPIGAASSLADRVLDTVARTPDAPALRDEAGVLSYRMLALAASEVASQLINCGASVGDRVAIHVPRGRGQVIAILGALLAGCVYVPLDVAVPDGRLSRITTQAEIGFAVTAGDHAVDGRWRDRGVTPIQVAPQGCSTPIVRRDCGPVAYVIFTSGSTGEPKGVVIRHDAVLNTVDAVNDMLGMSPNDAVLGVSSIGFDLSVYDIFGPLLTGATLVLLSEKTAKDPAAWVDIIVEHGVTVWNSAPALATLLAEEGGSHACLRAFLLSGDWIPLTLPNALTELAPEAEVISLGGATEGSIWSIGHRVVPDDCRGRSIPYGKALPRQHVLVLDEHGDECEPWHIGEIHIAGAGVADGYVNDDEKTSRAFVDHPRYGWMYRTGDRGRRDGDGVVEFLGRTDSQVKIGGHRVELGEIESLVAAKDYVHDVATAVSGDGQGVLAFVTLSATAPAQWAEQLVSELRNDLPSYMVPRSVVALDRIPLTGNGKVDRARLVALAPAAKAIADAEPGPADVHTQEVAGCWTRVLGKPAGGENFFDAGGNSFEAIRLLSLLRSALGYEVAFGKFLTDPTVHGLGRMCREAQNGSGAREVWVLTPRVVADPRGRVIFFPPVGGGVSCYSDLVRRLPRDIDIHIIGMDRPLGSSGALTLADLATACTRALPVDLGRQEIPCVLVGWSFGGALAFEAAAQLPPGTVSRVVLIDTPATDTARSASDDDSTLLAGFTEDIRQAGGIDIAEETVADEPVLADRFAVYRQNMRLLRRWEPRRTTAAVVECRASVRPAEPARGAWRAWADAVTSVDLTGDHFDVFTDDNSRHIQRHIESGLQ